MRLLTSLLAAGLTATLATVADAQAPRVTTAAHAAWSRDAVIYEVNVRQYTPEGTFAAFTRQIPRIKALGADILWLMPVQPIGRKNRKGVLGSYYSIADYTGFNPEFGTRADFEALVDAAHARGMKVILDWVPNHTAFDHPWITQHPDWYERAADGSIHTARDNEGKETDWTDVAELNYDSRAMRQAMLADMRFWLDEMKLDGFRCDVAGGVPDDFWREARATLGAARPGLFMLAEAEAPKFYGAFDMTYAWTFHHLLNDLSTGKQPVAALDRYFAEQARTYPADAYRMTFTSNHDENSWNGTEFERMGANHFSSFILSATTALSMPLLYSGQEVSLAKRLRFFERDTIDWTGPSLAPFYSRVFRLRHTQPALRNGLAGGPQVKLATNADDRVFAFTRTRGANTVLVAVNYGDVPVTAAYTGGLPQVGTFKDWFSGATVTLGASGTIAVPAHGYRVLVR